MPLLCRIFGIPYQVPRPITPELISLLKPQDILKSSSCQEILLGLSKQHIGPFVKEKITVDGSKIIANVSTWPTVIQKQIKPLSSYDRISRTK